MNIELIKTEKQREREIIKSIIEKFKGVDKVEIIRDEVAEMVRESIRESIKYDQMSKEEAPESYGVFFIRVHRVESGGWLMGITFYHTNRRHPLSADGLMVTISKYYIYKDHLGNIEILKPVMDIEE